MIVCCLSPARAESISVSEYRQQLHEIAEKVDALQSHAADAKTVISTIPDNVAVKTDSGEVNVSYKSLRDDLAAVSNGNEQKRAAILQSAQSYVQELSTAADSFEKGDAEPASAKGKLNEILLRREFKKVQGPTVKDTWLAKIYRWLSRLLEKLSGAGGNFDWLRLLIYILVGAAVAILAAWTIRRLRRPQEELPSREIIPFAPSARSWRTWLAEARELAQQQDWRNAIHLAYWAGISYLEEHGAWKPNRARTPREYLRLIGTRASQYPVLKSLTRKLEVVWYGYGSAGEADFQETLTQLEKLGCR
jgi:hypothetical protein